MLKLDPPEKLDLAKPHEWPDNLEAAFPAVQMRYEIEQGGRDSSDKCPYIYNGERGRTYIQSVYIWGRR